MLSRHAMLTVLFVLLSCLFYTASAASKVYLLKPQKVAEDVYVFLGKTEHFTFRNGGNIVNTGFIVGRDGVIVIDTGPSKLYGETMRKAISKITDKPIAQVIISHFHPDHFLGNQAFADTSLVALPETVTGIKQQGEMFNDAMYRLVGPWMKGTEVVVPENLDFQPIMTVAGRKMGFLKLSGHSGSDLAILDHQSGVLFAGDSVFFNRTPTTPHANIGQWLKELKQLSATPFKILVPGHGPVVKDQRAIKQTVAYLTWLRKSLSDAAARGQSMAEILTPDKSGKQFFSLSVFMDEYERSVAHLYPEIEQEVIMTGRVEQSEP